MQIDWTTFALEIINFLALVWILKRFLYQPVLTTLARRRDGVEQTLAEARASEARASELRAQYERRLADWDTEKAAARAQFEAEMTAERGRRMQALGEALEQERARSAAIDAHRQQQNEREQELRALAQARRFATALLARLADPAVEARLVDLLLDDFARLPEARFAGLRSAAAADHASAIVTSAFALDAGQRQRIGAALAARLGRELALGFAEDVQLLAGLRISLGPWHLQLNLADELAGFAAASNHAE